MFKLPAADSPLRAHFSAADLVLDKLPTLPQFRASAKAMIANGAPCPVYGVVLRGDGRITLERIGRRGGRKTLWTFQGATIRTQARLSRAVHHR